MIKLTVLVKRNAIGILMGVELILNAANVNLVAFNHFSHGSESRLDGQVFAMFVIVLAVLLAARPCTGSYRPLEAVPDSRISCPQALPATAKRAIELFASPRAGPPWRCANAPCRPGNDPARRRTPR